MLSLLLVRAEDGVAEIDSGDLEGEIIRSVEDRLVIAPEDLLFTLTFFSR